MSFLSHEYRKEKSAPKTILPAGNKLKQKIMETISEVTEIVGSTLGPNGRTVLIERPEPGLPPFQTKDGVTVIRSFCFEDEVKQSILETFRDAAIKTVENAGDGTSTSSILAGTILNKINRYLDKKNKISPQFAARELLKYLNDTVLPYIEKSSLKVDISNYNDLLSKVANISTNGDTNLSNKILEAFNLIGDNGHIHIVEEPAGYDELEVVKSDGYPFERGYEQSLGIFSNEFINDHDANRICLENPLFVLIDGKVLEMNPLIPLLSMIETEFQKGLISPNVVIMAHQFSKEVVAKLSQLWKKDHALKILPCTTPVDLLPNSQYDFLRDLAAFTGGKIFNSINNPVHNAVPVDLGQPAASFECQRYRSVVHGAGNETTILQRVSELRSQLKQPGNTRLVNSVLEERSGRLSGGIAKLVIRGVSDAMNREVRDRAEDAICAIRGAIKTGVLPGGCRILLNLSIMAERSDSELVREVLAGALREPLYRLLANCGLNTNEITDVIFRLTENNTEVYDAGLAKFGNPIELGILDSAPAVKEAIRSALSIATLLSTLGGVVVFQRDSALERDSARDMRNKQEQMDAVEPEVFE